MISDDNPLDEITSFSMRIETLVAETGIGYMEAIVELAEKQDIEIEVISKLISDPLKAKIQHEAENLHMIKKPTTGKLHFDESSSLL